MLHYGSVTANMTADFWVLSCILAVSFVLSVVSSFYMSVTTGVLTLVFGALYMAMVLWNQACVRGTANGLSCSVLAWLLVAGFMISLVIVIVGMVLAIRKRDKQGAEESDADDT